MAERPLDRGLPHAERHGTRQPEPPPAMALYDEPEVGRGKHLRDYLRVLHKRRWTALAVFLVVLGLGLLQALLAIPVYEARAQLLIEIANANVVDFKQVVESNTGSDYYPTQYRILQSRSLAARTIEAEKLVEVFNRPGQVDWSLLGMIGRARASVSQFVGGLFQREEPTVPADGKENETAQQSAMIDAFLGSLTIAPVRGSRLVDVKYTAADPHVAARIVNALCHAYIQQNIEFTFSTSKDATDWLAARLDEQRKKVEESELALQRYRERSDAVPLEDRQNITVQRLADLSSSVTKARTERIQKEALFVQLKGMAADDPNIDTFPAILANAFIQQLKGELGTLQRQRAQMAERLGEKHPEMIKLTSAVETAQARLRIEISKVTDALRNDYLAAEAQERSLVSALEGQKAEALAMNRRGIEYSVLSREAESNRQIYQTLLQRTNETGITGELKSNNIRLVDAAEVPRAPTVARSSGLLKTFLLGLVLACGFVFFLEYLDNRIKSPEEIHTELGLAFLGMVPVSKPEGSTGRQLLIEDGAPSAFVEAFRSVRTNLLFSATTTGQRAIVITSTAPGEGKTVVSTNLAVALAQAGQRVLAVDADMRRPQIHERFGIEAEPGLSNLLVGDAEMDKVVQKGRTDGLWLIPAGKVPPNPAELLSSQRFRDFVDKVQGEYDWVLLDSPPLMAVTDAAVVAHVARNVVFVIAADSTPRDAARTALEFLDGANAHVLGAVFNRANLERNRYYYSEYYRREYGDYYQRKPGSSQPAAKEPGKLLGV